MAWKSREGKLPPANYYAQIMAYLGLAYPEAVISQTTMAALKPAWDRLWLEGRSPEIAAKTTCSCDGRSITLSPALPLHIPRGSYRGPSKTERGVLFEPQMIRESTEAERAKRQALALQSSIGRITTQTTRLETRLGRAKTEEARTELRAEIGRQRAELETKKQAVDEIGRKLVGLRQQLGTLAEKFGLEKRQAEAAQARKPKAKAPKPAKPPKAPKPKKEKTPKPKKEKTPKPKKEKTPKPPKAPKTPKVSKQAQKDKAIMDAILAAMPNVATEIAAQAKKGG